MPLYDYAAMNAKGEMRQGSLDVPDPGYLKKALSDQGLFLVSYHFQERRQAVSDPSPTPSLPNPQHNRRITDQDKLSPLQRKIQRVKDFLCSPKGMLLVATCFLLGIGSDYIYFKYFSAINPFVGRGDVSTQDLLRGIHVGSTRADVEQFFPDRFPDGSSAEQTLYVMDSSWLVAVHYDAIGGSWSSHNRVTQPLQLVKQKLSH